MMHDSLDLVHREHERHALTQVVKLGPSLGLRMTTSSRSVFIDVLENLFAWWTTIPLARSMF
jgi:hypothetical protein